MKKDCDTCRHIDVDYDNMPCSLCEDFDKWESKTNADHIRAMTDEELGRFCIALTNDGWPYACQNKPECDPVPNDPSDCDECFINWLKQPYKEDGNG